MSPRIVPFIFNWKGQFEKAQQTEGLLRRVSDEVVVINSDDGNTRPGWVDLGDECYFTAQFFKALDLFDGDILFHVQADATYDDWQGVFDHALRYLDAYNWGVYAPNIDFTGWQAAKVDIESDYFREPDLRLVANTDCTCWFIHRDILTQFAKHRTLFADNKYGWGLDLTMAALSYLIQRPVIRDYGHTIVHPRGHGYDNDRASYEYRVYLNSVGGELKATLNLILRDRQGLLDLLTSTRPRPRRSALP